MKFGMTALPDPPWQRLVELMQLAEGHGFEYGWTYDSHILWQEPYVIYSQILAATRQGTVGPMGTNPATRDRAGTGSPSAYACVVSVRRSARSPHSRGSPSCSATGKARIASIRRG